ncbi:hypothetical protein RA27_08720 [Ruegeria sp. ANG-R]|uniref:helix-turn-helix domain-containing protein n=1 Tax=Ruegeria sp. ANG-R TaxID=1577903 RepID=UPI00057EACF3|nr:helix-turn-helix transcriptional regulator [Ruegeria sp. ANG-R]KIC43344.1 hypothetical protein RA27_08720 [Ruegeria sp. ANG-R]
MSTLYFSHELREFRQAAGLTRKDMAQILAISDYTVRSWENGKANPQSKTLWGILDHLASPDLGRLARGIDIDRLRSIIEDYARSLQLSPVESDQSKLLSIERTLSGSVLKAAQTDFRYDGDTRALVTAPFYSDLALFEAADGAAVKGLLDDAIDAAETIVSKLEDVNIEQRYLSDTLKDYARQCKEAIPNPRILERKGGLTRYVYASEDISNSVNPFLLKEIEQFLDIHNELMRGLFGEALSAARQISSEKVSDDVLDVASSPFDDAVAQLERIRADWRKFGAGSASIDPNVVAIVSDVGKEVTELELAASQANDPNTRSMRVARLKVAAFHGALLIGRLLLRTTGAILTHGSNVAAIAGIVEIASPGSIRAAYELLRSVIPDLPPLPVL